MGTFARRGLVASQLGHCGSPVPITRDAAIPPASFYIAWGTRVLPLRTIPRELLVRRSPGYLPVVGRLDAVLDPGVAALRSSVSRSPHGLLPCEEDRPGPKLRSSRGYVSDSGLHPSPRRSRYSSFLWPLGRFSRFTTGRLTRPYPGRLTCFLQSSSSIGNHCQVAPQQKLAIGSNNADDSIDNIILNFMIRGLNPLPLRLLANVDSLAHFLDALQHDQSPILG